MNLGLLKSRVRRLKASPTTTRWTDADLADTANQASIQLGIAVDFPQATQLINTLQTPTSAPTVTVDGTPGSQEYVYAYCNVAQFGGDSVPSPNAQVLNGASVLTSVDYNAISFPSVAGNTYRVLRQRIGIELFPTLLCQVQATGSTITVNDQGQYQTQLYRVTRGNEYALPDLIKILRVYLIDQAGNTQPLEPSDISWLGGDTNESWDQSSGTVQGYPQYTPQWIAQGPSPYPVQGPYGGRKPVATPWTSTLYATQNPVYYLRGGYLGLLPPPDSAGYQIMYDFVPKQPVMQQNSDLSIFPDAFCDAICWKMLEYLCISDSDSRDADFSQRFMDACRQLRIDYVDTLQANKPRAVVPLPIRVQVREWPI